MSGNSDVVSGSTKLKNNQALQIASSVVLGQVLGRNAGDDGSDTDDNIQLGETATDVEMPALPAPHGPEDTMVHQIKNDPDEIKKIRAKVLKGVADMTTGRMMLREFLAAKGDNSDVGKVIQSKLGDSVDHITEAIVFWEDVPGGYQYADLPALKKRYRADVEMTNKYLSVMRALK